MEHEILNLVYHEGYYLLTTHMEHTIQIYLCKKFILTTPHIDPPPHMDH